MASGYWQDASEAALKEFKANGVTIVKADPSFEAELKSASIPITQAWIEKANSKGIDGQAAYDFYRTRVEELTQ